MEFINGKNVKKEHYNSSFSLRVMNHCKMDLIVEELALIDKFNVLIIGTEECSFYSRKVKFNNAKSYAYIVKDEELVFGNLNGLKKALQELKNDSLQTVIIGTCIPLIMNLDIASILDDGKFLYIEASEYSGVNSQDILADLYCLLFKDKLEFLPNQKMQIIDQKKVIETFKKSAKVQLNSKNVLINDFKLLKLFSDNNFEHNINSYDFYHVFPFKYYIENKEIFNISDEELNKVKQIISEIKVKEEIAIKGVYSLELVNFLKDDLKINNIILPYLNNFSFNLLKKTFKYINVSFSYFEDSQNLKLIDLSEFDNYEEKNPFKKISVILEYFKNAIC